MRPSSQRFIVFVLFAAAPLLVAGTAFAELSGTHGNKQGAARQAPAAVVKIVDNRFEPATVTIKAGQTVEWQNTGVTGHSVTADPAKAKERADVQLPEGAKPFNSGSLKHGAAYHHTFKAPGTYKYFCMGHEGKGMVGTVVVEPAEGAGHNAGHRSTGSGGGMGY